ncbi:hypothetical protein Z946_3140 [Sulfitobacter noctilucicola]|nr:hypothetical protein Z946_3140 [Sulfitobacter noctilucicola]
MLSSKIRGWISSLIVGRSVGPIPERLEYSRDYRFKCRSVKHA